MRFLKHEVFEVYVPASEIESVISIIVLNYTEMKAFKIFSEPGYYCINSSPVLLLYFPGELSYTILIKADA